MHASTMSHPHTLTSPVPFCLTQYLANLAKREERKAKRKAEKARQATNCIEAMDAGPGIFVFRCELVVVEVVCVCVCVCVCVFV